jgi:IclR family transcriptional regulator, KDG regulon repressor
MVKTTQSKPDNKKQSSVQSISRAASIISCLGNGIDTMTEIAGYCKLNKSTVHRLLKALGESRITRQDPLSHRYYLGDLITEIASKTGITHQHLTITAVGEMTRLSDITEETITLSVMSGISHSSLFTIPSKYYLQVIAANVRATPSCEGAAEKILFSQLDDEILKEAIKNIRIRQVTENTVTDKSKLLNQIRQVQQQGYCISYGEVVRGAACISAPIKRYVVPASLSIVAPIDRVNPKIASFVKELLSSVQKISQSLNDKKIRK